MRPCTRLLSAGRAIALVLCAVLTAAGPPAAAAPPAQSVVKVFTLKYRKIEDALPLLRPLLSDSGAASAVLETSLNSLTVRGTPARIEQITRAVAAFDVPPRGFDIAVTLLKSAGEKTRAEKADVSQEIRGIGEKLKKLFNVTDFTRLDSVVVRGTEGQRVVYVMGGGYRLEFLLDASREGTQVQLRDLSLERVRHEAGKEIRGEILRTSINVNLGQPYILGVGRDESAGDKLFVVFFANWRQPGPGIN
ncbi:MAG TPA: secretin N-terminal domain-containing protein [Thermoanaerobaculia bacterium]|nr:secretin N-terminal domain-containing protein [Thermoanaerobaculia bacterium]